MQHRHTIPYQYVGGAFIGRLTSNFDNKASDGGAGDFRCCFGGRVDGANCTVRQKKDRWHTKEMTVCNFL